MDRAGNANHGAQSTRPSYRQGPPTAMARARRVGAPRELTQSTFERGPPRRAGPEGGPSGQRPPKRPPGGCGLCCGGSLGAGWIRYIDHRAILDLAITAPDLARDVVAAPRRRDHRCHLRRKQTAAQRAGLTSGAQIGPQTMKIPIPIRTDAPVIADARNTSPIVGTCMARLITLLEALKLGPRMSGGSDFNQLQGWITPFEISPKRGGVIESLENFRKALIGKVKDEDGGRPNRSH
jgi:hypothetical protein